jgi:hypothetical protein
MQRTRPFRAKTRDRMYPRRFCPMYLSRYEFIGDPDVLIDALREDLAS